jgi:hypothetical protein
MLFISCAHIVSIIGTSKGEITPPLQYSDRTLMMRRGVDGFSPSIWAPQKEGMMTTSASFSLRKKPRFVSPGKSQTPEGDAC